MPLRSPFVPAFLLALSAVAACNAKVATVLEPPDAGLEPGLPDEDRPLVPANKVDVLFVVDDSAGMADKSSRLASSVGGLLRFAAKTGDVHVGVVSSSLGTPGGDICPDAPGMNGHAHLRTTGPDGTTAAANGVLGYTAGADLDDFVARAESLIRGVGQAGCGFEAQLETMYRFLVQPDPWSAVPLDSNQQAVLLGVDFTLLGQRKTFLRPDSALVVVMVTDEDDSNADPLSVEGQGWAFTTNQFPGSNVVRDVLGRTAPRGTSVCATDPASDRCTSCAFKDLCDSREPACAAIGSDPNCTTSGMPGAQGKGYDGYYSPAEDALNVRFHRMKERFGIDPQFPLARYVDGLGKSVVADRSREHPEIVLPNGRREVAAYAGSPNCTNPIFAASLPGAGEELCALPRGPRSRELVLFALLGGLPPALATGAPDWTRILGARPEAYDFAGIDTRMIASVASRAGLPEPGSADVEREYDTRQRDLQYACTFALAEPRACTADDPSCPCASEGAAGSPLCEGTSQVRAKAYPTLRPLRVARDLGERAVVGSVCDETYQATMQRIQQRLSSRIVF